MICVPTNGLSVKEATIVRRDNKAIVGRCLFLRSSNEAVAYVLTLKDNSRRTVNFFSSAQPRKCVLNL